MALMLPLLTATEPYARTRLSPAFEPPENARVYNYAPCLVRTRDALHVWYCANKTSGDITDYLFHRKATRRGGTWVWGPEDVALDHGSPRTAWDSRHVCDPEVVAGRFRFRGQTWTHAMLYLGCDAESSTHNQVGVAFAKSLDGPWTRYPDPIIRYTDAPEAGVVGEYFAWPVYRYWGVGQPAAISLDRRGKLLVFYSRGEDVWGEMMVEADLSDMDRGPVIGEPKPLPSEGLLDERGGALPAIMNVGVALDEGAGSLYLVGEGRVRSDGRHPDFISADVPLMSIPWKDLRKGAGTWKILGRLDAARTGWPRNHNAAIMKDVWGRLPSGKALTIGVSWAEAYDALPPNFEWLWTYRIGLVEMPR